MAERNTGSRTPQERVSFRKSQYKSRTGWKDKYRQRCTDRLKASRELLVDRLRKIGEGMPGSSMSLPSSSREEVADTVQNVMEQEWERLRSEYNLPTIDSLSRKRKISLLDGGAGSSSVPKRLAMQSNGTGGPDVVSMEIPDMDTSLPNSSHVEDTPEDLDAVLAIVEEIKEELISEEHAGLAQYEEISRFNERELSATLDCSASEEVMCPVCRKNFLCQNLQLIYCPCGLRIDTAQDCITLDFVRQQLAHGISLHSEHCAAMPDFSVDTVMTMQNLVMNCPVCDFLYIIL